MMSCAKVVFFGADAIGLPALESLAAAPDLALAGVVSQPDRASGRGRRERPNAVAAWARENGATLFQPEAPGRDLAEWMREREVDLALVMAYGHLLKRPLREAPKRPMLNLHGSILPQYRGPSPVETAVAMGERGTGVSLMRMAARMDAGDVADVERVTVADRDTGPTVREKIAHACVPLLARTLRAELDGCLAFEPQDEANATYCRKLTKRDGALDFRQPARDIANRVRAFVEWPGASFECGGERVRVGAASAERGDAGAEPGTVLPGGDALRVAADEGVVALEQLQRPGGRMLPAADFLRGYPLAEGTVLESRPATRLVGDAPGFGSGAE